MIDIKVRKAWFLQSSDIHLCQRLYSVSHRGNTQRAMPLFKSDYVVNWAACWATLRGADISHFLRHQVCMISCDYEEEYRSIAWKLSAFNVLYSLAPSVLCSPWRKQSHSSPPPRCPNGSRPPSRRQPRRGFGNPRVECWAYLLTCWFAWDWD